MDEINAQCATLEEHNAKLLTELAAAKKENKQLVCPPTAQNNALHRVTNSNLPSYSYWGLHRENKGSRPRFMRSNLLDIPDEWPLNDLPESLHAAHLRRGSAQT